MWKSSGILEIVSIVGAHGSPNHSEGYHTLITFIASKANRVLNGYRPFRWSNVRSTSQHEIVKCKIFNILFVI